ncbi:MAG: efflux RND transporter periplasmic adaptor subunit [Candidatus Omnitrophica bacterium]|nr:efflux RND transporter periplasmic adaptor subunit [Candidatus Omnitrophota bacterium]
MKKKKYILWAVIFLAAAILIARAGVRHWRASAVTVEEEAEIYVETERAKIVALPEKLEAIGNIEPFKTVIIYPEATGILERLSVKEGDFVKKGQVIANIEGEQRRLAAEQVENEIKSQQYQLENIRRDYDRYKRLYDEGVVAAKRFEDIETLYNSTAYRIKALEAQLDTAKRRLQDTSVAAPITGIVAERFIDEGELVTESTMTKTSPLVSIVDIGRVKVTVPVGGIDISKIKEGQASVIETDVYPGRSFPGRVNKIMPVTDFTTRTTTVEVLADNPDYMLRPGVFARVSIDTGARSVLAVSMDALMRMPGSGSYYCFRLSDGLTVEKVYIDTGVIRDGVVEITGGLKEGDIIVVTSQGVLETGKKVVPASSPPLSGAPGGGD